MFPLPPFQGDRARPLRHLLAGTLLAVLLLAVLLLGSASFAEAQTVPDEEPPPPDSTRQERLRQQRLEKKRRLHPPEEGFFVGAAASIESFIERNQLVINLPSLDLYGLRPVFGGLRSGAGTTAGLRLPFYRERDGITSYVEALASLNRYYGVQGTLGYEDSSPWVAYVYGRYWHNPEEDFYGVGPDSEEDRSSYRLNEFIGGGLAGYELLPGVLVGGHASYQTNRYGLGQDDSYPTVDEAFLDAEVPGLGTDVDYFSAGAYAEYDSRNIADVRAYGSRFAPTENRLRGISLDATQGFYFAAEAIPHFAIGKGSYNFTRFNFESQQYLPIRHGYQVLALREFMTLTHTPDGNAIPFYKMETLGGSRTLRGFNTFRFRDRSAALVNAEFRWEVFQPLDLALFVDAGHVFGELSELRLENLEAGYGLGFRIKSDQRVIARFDIARSREGFSTYLSLGSIL